MLNIEMNHLRNAISLNYGLDIKSLKPVEYGADSSAERFKLLDARDNAYFVKVLKEVSGNNLKLLSCLGKALGDCIITPVESDNAELYVKFDDYFIVIFPFIEGRNGFEEALTSKDIQNAGRIIRDLHSLDANYLKDKFGVKQYTHNQGFRIQIRQILLDIENIKTEDSIVLELKDFIKSKSARVDEILNLLDDLNSSTLDKDCKLSLCHTDIHVGNILKSLDGNLYIVDWDQAAIGHRELDLLFFGGGIAGNLSIEQEIKSFYSGYGDCSIDYKKLAFYRFARIIEDIALFYQEITNLINDYDRRKQAFKYLKSNFNHNETIDCAFRTLQYIK